MTSPVPGDRDYCRAFAHPVALLPCPSCCRHPSNLATSSNPDFQSVPPTLPHCSTALTASRPTKCFTQLPFTRHLLWQPIFNLTRSIGGLLSFFRPPREVPTVLFAFLKTTKKERTSLTLSSTLFLLS